MDAYIKVKDLRFQRRTRTITMLNTTHRDVVAFLLKQKKVSTINIWYDTDGEKFKPYEVEKYLEEHGVKPAN